MAENIPLKLYYQSSGQGTYLQANPSFNTPYGWTEVKSYDELYDIAKKQLDYYKGIIQMGISRQYGESWLQPYRQMYNSLGGDTMYQKLVDKTATTEDIIKAFGKNAAINDVVAGSNLTDIINSYKEGTVIPSSYSNVGGVMVSKESIAEEQKWKAMVAAGTAKNIGTQELPLYVPTGSAADLAAQGKTQTEQLATPSVQAQVQQQGLTPVTPTTPVVGQTLANISGQPTTKKEISGVPAFSAEYDQWIAQGRTFESGKWYEPTGGMTAQQQAEVTSALAQGATMTPEQKQATIEQLKQTLQSRGIDTSQYTTTPLQTTEGIRTEGQKTQEEQAKKTAEETIKSQEELAKLQTQSEIQKYKEQLGLTTPVKPTTVNFESTYNTLTTQYGVNDLTSSINSVNSQLTALQDSLTAGLYDEEGKLRPMELISTRQQEMTRQVQEKLNTLNRSKENLVAELNTKNTIISNIMSLKQTDYSNAQQEYESEYAKQMDFISLSRDIEKEAKTDAQALVNAAQANLNTIINMSEGKTWGELDSTIKTQIQQLELKSGLPFGITEAFLNAKPDAEVLTTTTGYDASGNQIITFVYKNPDGTVGTTKTITTGGVASKTIEGVGTATNQALVSALNQSLVANNAFGVDGKVSWETYVQMQQYWVNNGGTSAEFKINYPIAQYLDKGNQTEYEKTMGKDTEDALQQLQNILNNM